MRIFAYPLDGIAYNDSLYREVGNLGVDVRRGEWGGRWIMENITRHDVIHIHWPSFLYESSGSVLKVATSFVRYVALLLLLSIRSKKVLWTAHNLLPHDRCRFPIIDIWARRVVIALCKGVFVHGKEAEQELTERFSAAAGKCVRIPHGNWIDHYPPCSDRRLAREVLRVPPSGFLYLLFGQCKRYKNIEQLVRVFRRIARRDDFLLIAGKFSDPEYLRAVLDCVGGDSRIRIDARFIQDNEVATYLAACDAMCMPYREILTSGTTMLALSHGRPILSIDRGFLREVVSPECGVLVASLDEAALSKGLTALRDGHWHESEILERARRYTFNEAAQITARVARAA